jgi:general secretion pathway protein G
MTPTSATCHPNKPAPHPGRKPGRQGAFTLLEMLVVLLIVGLLASMGLPRLQRLAQSLEWANQRQGLIGQIDNLPYQAYASAQEITLDTNAASVIDIPADWQIKVAQPLRYSANGVCSGGQVTLRDPAGSEEVFTLKAPLCHIEAGQA